MRGDKLALLAEKCRFGNEVFDTELVVRSFRAGLRLCEIPVFVEEKRPSRTGSLKRAWRMVRQLLVMRVALGREGVF